MQMCKLNTAGWQQQELEDSFLVEEDIKDLWHILKSTSVSVKVWETC